MSRARTVTAIIQARMTSSRLPGKVLMRVLGKPLLAYMLERVARAERVSGIVVATTVNADDDAVADLAAQMDIPVFRGSEANVLERFHQAAVMSGAEHVMRLTADCPITDWTLLDELVAFYFDGGYDYACNCLDPTLPDGLDAEVFSFAALDDAQINAELPSHREHVTPYIRQCGAYGIGSWKHAQDHSHLRWTVDEKEDFELVQSIIETLYPGNDRFRYDDVLAAYEAHPEWNAVNTMYARNEGAVKSRQADKVFLHDRAKGDAT